MRLFQKKTPAHRKLPAVLPGTERRTHATSRRDQFFASSGYGGFQGAKRDRLTEEWSPPSLTATAIHRMDATMLRNRARDLVANNPLARSVVDSYIANVIECGISPKPRFSDIDRRKQWMRAWNHWAGVTGLSFECDSTGQQTFHELTALWLEEVIVGGGCLVHYKVMRPSRSRRIPLALELIPEEQFVDDRDDFIQFQNRKKSSNPIIRGIEIQASTGRPVAYWIHHTVLTGDDGAEPVRLPADQCHYSFFRKRIGQYRGVTLLHAAIMWLWKLGYYTDNELMASAIKSCYAAVIQQDKEDWDNDAQFADGDPDGPVVDAYGNAIEKIQPGIIARMTVPGKISGVGPNVPPSDSIGWVNFIERSIAIGGNLSYEEIARDYSRGNFSSTRASANSDRKRFRPMQKFCVNHFGFPSYTRFGQWASMRGLEGFPAIDDFVANIDDWLDTTWNTPGWESVNPWDDVRASVLATQNGMNTRENFLSDRGHDWEETFDQLEREEQAREDRGLTFAGPSEEQEESAQSQGAENGA